MLGCSVENCNSLNGIIGCISMRSLIINVAVCSVKPWARSGYPIKTGSVRGGSQERRCIMFDIIKDI